MVSVSDANPEMPVMAHDPERTRGRYVDTLAGAPAGIDERFVLGEIAPGVVRARTTRISARPVSRLESDVRVEPGRTSVAMRWVGSGSGAIRDASAELIEERGAVTASRTVEGVTTTYAAQPGRVQAAAHVQGGPLVVGAVGGLELVEPDLYAPEDPEALFSPVPLTWTTTRSTPVGAASVVVSGVERAGTAYDWVDSRSERPAVIVVDEGGLILRVRMQAPDGLLEVTLAEVTGPWPTPATWGR